MTGQNDRQDRSLTGQVCDQAGHCPLTGRYLQPWFGKLCLQGPILTAHEISFVAGQGLTAALQTSKLPHYWTSQIG